jgi:acetyltransferase
MWPALRSVTSKFRLPGGRPMTVRPVAPTDRDDIQAFVRDLEPETRRRRYFTPIRELPEPMLDALAHPDPARESVFVAVAEDDAHPRMVGLAQYATAEPAKDCEVALVIADDVQGQGLGSRLMAILLDAAKTRGYRRAVGDVLRENRAMITLARRTGFDVGVNDEDPDLIRIVRRLDDGSGPMTRPSITDLVWRGLDSLRSLAPRARGGGPSGLEPV